MTSKIKVIFVCLGNICRSPAAEAIFNYKIKTLNISDRFEVDSAGTSGHHDGEPADARMIAAAKARGIPVPSISRKFTAHDFSHYDYIVVMDESNYKNVMRLNSGELASKVSLMTDYVSGDFSKYDHVLDPYFGGDDGFNHVLDLLENCCSGFIKKII